MGIRTKNQKDSEIFEEFSIDKRKKTAEDKRLRAGKSARKPKKDADVAASVNTTGSAFDVSEREHRAADTVKTIEIRPRKPRQRMHSQLPPKLDDTKDDKIIIRTVRDDMADRRDLSVPDINELKYKKQIKKSSLNERNERRLRAEAAAKKAAEEKIKAEEAKRKAAAEEREKKQAARERLLEEKRLREKIKREEELTKRLRELREEKERELKELERIKKEKEELIAAREKALTLIEEEKKRAKEAAAGFYNDKAAYTGEKADASIQEHIKNNIESYTGSQEKKNEKINASLSKTADDEIADEQDDAEQPVNEQSEKSVEVSENEDDGALAESEKKEADKSECDAEADWSKPPADDALTDTERKPFYKRKGFIAAAAVCTVAAGGYGYGVYYYSQRFLPHTYAERIDIGGLTPKEAEQKLEASDIAGTITLKGRDSKELLDLSGANAGITVDSLSEALDEQSHAAWIAAYLDREGNTVSFSVICDEAALNKAIDALSMLDPANIIMPEDAYAGVDPDTGEYGIIPEVKGNQIDRESLENAVKNALSAGELSIDLDKAGVYVEPNIKSDDGYLRSNIGTMAKLNRAGAAVDLGAGLVYSLDGERMFGLLGDDGHADTDKVRALVSEFAGQYNTVSSDGIRTIKTHHDTEKELHTSYGWLLDEDATFNVLCDLINGAADLTLADGAENTDIDQLQFSAAAVWKQTAASHGDTDYGNSYIEIDMGEQNVYVYVDGECVFETPCVTGKMVKDRSTPEGLYAIRYKQTNRVLTGYNPDGSVSYRSPVKYWMPFNKGVGLHDASWRRKFGGDLYKTSGSHGCINLPKDAAAQIYEIVYPGMPVMCYY